MGLNSFFEMWNQLQKSPGAFPQDFWERLGTLTTLLSGIAAIQPSRARREFPGNPKEEIPSGSIFSLVLSVISLRYIENLHS